jgi:hypothetical protein
MHALLAGAGQRAEAARGIAHRMSALLESSLGSEYLLGVR